MDRARQIKEEVNQATEEIKCKVEKNNEDIRNKAGTCSKATIWSDINATLERLMEAGDKFAGEARDILRPEIETVDFRDRYGLRGRKLAGLIAGIVLIAILAVYGKIDISATWHFLLLL